MKLLVVGYGSMGKRHADRAFEMGHAVHVHDVEAPGEVPRDETVRKYHVGHFGPDVEYAPLFAWAEAVVIATPVATHFALLRQAWDAGLPVLVEKPVAESVSAVLSGLDGALRRPDAPLAIVGYNLRFHRGLLHARDHGIPRAGAPRLARFEVSCDMSTWPGTYADALLECSHEIDIALWLLGPATLHGAAQSGGAWELLLRHASGCVTTVRLNGSYHGYMRTGEVVGDAGWCRWRWYGDALYSPFLIKTSDRTHYKWDCPVEDTYRRELEYFLANATRPGPRIPVGGDPCTLEQGLETLAICDQARVVVARLEAGLTQ